MSRSYYGRPVIKETIWGSPEVPGYLFLGGLAGASSMLAGFAHASGHQELARVSKTAATGAIALSAVALVKDLGRPGRFLNMLRVVKVTSPMSVGTWLITSYGPLAGAAAASALTGKLPKAGAAATVGAAALGAGVSTYTAALICDTAVPAWHDGHREMPYLFAGSAATAAGGLGMLAVAPRHAGPAVRFAVLGALTELTAKRLLLKRLGEGAKPYQQGRAGKLLEAGEVLTAAGLAGAVLASRDRTTAALSGLALLASSALTRFGIFEAGRASARDPAETIEPQRRRLLKDQNQLPRTRYYADEPIGGEMGHVSCFLRDGDRTFLTYSTTGRGTEPASGSFALLDMTPYGRGEAWQASPDGWPEGHGPCWYWRSDAAGNATWGPTSRPVPQWTRPGATPAETLGRHEHEH